MDWIKNKIASLVFCKTKEKSDLFGGVDRLDSEKLHFFWVYRGKGGQA